MVTISEWRLNVRFVGMIAPVRVMRA